MKLLLYCTKSKPFLINDCGKFYLENKGYNYYWKKGMVALEHLNGKIVAECDFEVEEIINDAISSALHWYSRELLKKACLNGLDLSDYLNGENGYVIHIKNLNIFDKPKELNEFYKIEDVGGMLFTKPLSNAPQNMMRVSINQWEYATYDPNDINVLISIRPEWLCKILNGGKTIEVRKKVLKEMLNDTR